MSRLATHLLVATLCVCLSSRVEAEPTEKEKKLPKTGNLSTSFNSGAASSSVPDPFGGVAIGDEESSPITGSVSRVDENTWRMRVFNNSEDVYSVNLGVIQRDDRGATVKTDGFSYTLKPGSSEEQTISSASGAIEAALDLRSYRKLTKSKPAPDSASEAAPSDVGAGAQ